MAKEKAEKVELVKMQRAAPAHPGGPTTADVHPDEVGDYLAGGWSVAPEDKPPAK